MSSKKAKPGVTDARGPRSSGRRYASMNQLRTISLLFPLATLAACSASSDDDPSSPDSGDAVVADAPEVPIDRFGAGAMLQRRAADPSLPGPDEPIDFDRAPFITQGLGPLGEPVRYYNFDVQSPEPAAVYVLMREGETEP